MSTRCPTVILQGDERVVLRPIVAADTERLTGYFEALSPESRRLRFHQPVPVVKSWLVRPLAEVDQDDHVAWSAWSGCEIVGEARYVRSRHEPGAAEVAFSVADRVRRRGLGRVLVETLGLIARHQGVHAFTSTVGSDNRPSASFLAALDTRLTFGDGALEGRGPVPAWSGSDELAACVLGHHLARFGGTATRMAA